MDLDNTYDLDLTSDNHTGLYEGNLHVLHAMIACDLHGGKLYEQELDYGGWIAAHSTCPFCGEHFRILNPEPMEHL